MPRWTLFALLPLLAAALVFAPTLLSPSSKGRTAIAASESSTLDNPPASKLSRRTQGESLLPSGLQVGASLVFVLALALGGIWLIRRLQPGAVASKGQRSIEIKETRRLGKQRAIHLVRVSDRLLLLSEAETGIGLLSDLTISDPETASLDLGLAEPGHVLRQLEEQEEGATPRDLLPGAKRSKRQAQLGDFRQLLGKIHG